MNRLYKKLFGILTVAFLFSIMGTYASRPAYAGQDDHSFVYEGPAKVEKGKLFTWNVHIMPPIDFGVDATFKAKIYTYGNDQWNTNNHNPIAFPRVDTVNKSCSSITKICEYTWTGIIYARKPNNPYVEFTTWVKEKVYKDYHHFAEGYLDIYYGGADFQRRFSQDLIIE